MATSKSSEPESVAFVQPRLHQPALTFTSDGETSNRLQ